MVFENKKSKFIVLLISIDFFDDGLIDLYTTVGNFFIISKF